MVRPITIDTGAPEALSPYIFGHNFEHTRGAVTTGLSAQLIKNRKFVGKASKNEGCPMGWTPLGGDNLFMEQYNIQAPYSYDRTGLVHIYTRHYDPENRHHFNDRQSLGLQNLSGQAFVGVAQGGLQLTAGQGYEFRAVVWSDDDAALTAQLTSRAGDIYAAIDFSVRAGDWRFLEGVLTPAQTDDDTWLTLSFSDRTRVTLGAVSLLPQGHFHGMRTDVIARLKEIGPTLLRWPGGNFAGEYLWMDGLLPADERACLQAHTEIETQPYMYGFDNHEIDTDDFIALCREIGAEPMITINAAFYSPRENAAWVEYCNGGPETEYGALRAKRGHEAPYNVKFWALGNEMGHGHMEGPRGPEAYARLAREQAEAMRAVTPDIRLFVSGIYPNVDWVEKCARPLKDVAPYVSLHYYASAYLNYTSPERAAKTARDTLEKPVEARGYIQALRKQLGPDCRISFDEWNVWAAWYRPSCAVDGLFAARMLHMLTHESVRSGVDIACYFQPLGEGAMEIKSRSVELTGMGQVFALMKAHVGGELCRLEGLDELDALATVKEGVVTLTLVNADLKEKTDVRLAAAGKLLRAETLMCETLMPHSRLKGAEAAVSRAGEDMCVALPPLSLTLIQMEDVVKS